MRLVVAALLAGMVGLGLFVYEALLPETLAPQIVQALEERLGPGHHVTIGGTRLAADTSGVQLEIDDLVVTGVDGRQVAAAPHAMVKLDGGALIGGQIAVSSLQLENPSLVLRSPQDDAAAAEEPAPRPASPAEAAGPTPEQTADANRDLLSHLVGTLDHLTEAGGAAAALDEVRVTSGSLAVDRGDGKPAEMLERVNLRVARDPVSNGFSVTLFSDGPSDRWSATLTSSPPTAQGRVFDLGLENVRLSNLRRVAFGKKEGPDATVSGHVNLQVDNRMTIASAEMRIGIGDILVHVPDPVHPSDVHLEQLLLRGRWDGATRVFTLDPSTISDEGGYAGFTGLVRFPEKGSQDPISYQVRARDILIPGEQGEAPLRLDQISFKGSYDTQKQLLDIAVGQVLGPSVKVAMSGGVQFGQSSPAVTLGLAALPTPVSAFKRLWPKFLLPDIRQWAVANVKAGILQSFQMTLDIKEGVLASLRPQQNLPDDALYIETTFTDGTVTPLPDMPTLTAMAGTLKITGRTATLQADAAQVETGSGPMLLTGSYRMPDTNPKFPQAHVSLTTNGPLSGIAELFVQNKLGPNPLPPILKADAMHGAVNATAEADFTIGPPEDVPPPVVRVNGELKDVTVDNLVAGKALEAGNFRITRDPAMGTLTGEAKVAGAPAKIELFDEGPGKRREVLAALTLDQAARVKLGFQSNAGIKGNVEVKVKMGLDEGAPIDMQADLGPAAIDGLVPGFKKKAGAPGRLAVNVVKTGELTSLQDIVLESGPVLVKGSAELNDTGELLSARLSTYKLRASDDIRVSVDKVNDRLKLDIAGSSFDLRPLMSDLFSGKAGEENSADLDLDLNLAAGTGFNGESVSGLRMSMARDGDRVRSLELSANRIGNGRLTVTPAGDAGTFIATGTDAGSFFRFLDIYAKAVGGKFNLQLTSAKTMSGVLEVENFQVKGEKALASVAGSTAIRTEGRRNPEMKSMGDPSTVQFTKLHMAFDRDGGKLTVRDVVLWGPQIGLSLEGALDFNADKVSVVGTFVPAFALNNLFSKLPVIGFFLGGGSSEGLGLVGVTFRITGALSKPTLTINPMSAVAPGFLRKLFEFRQREAQGKTASGQSGSPAVTPR